MENPKLKGQNGELFDGKMLAEYVQQCASVDVPIIEDVWQIICNKKCLNFLNESEIELINAIEAIILPEKEEKLVTELN